MTVSDMETGLISALTGVLIDHEGERMKVYKDSLGIPTAGVGLALMVKLSNGTLVPSAYAKGLCSKVGVEYDGLLAGTVELTLEQSRQLLSLCIIDVLEWVTKIFPAFWTYTQPRQIALGDMGFELGETKFRGFRLMISCILAGNWAGAAANAVHSEWAEEVPERAAYDAGLLRAG